jgi:nuclear transport factor 2 (NTF2) superfamily protein
MHQIIVIIFATLSAMALTTAQISINGLTLPRSSINDMPIKRQQQEATYQWPRVDGPQESFPPLDLLV